MTNTKIPPEMHHLHPLVKKRAMEIANRLKSENLMPDFLTVNIAIKKAEAWANQNHIS